MALVEYLDRGALRDPDGDCLVSGDVRLSYRDVQQLTYRIGRRLGRLGLGPGDNGAILAFNDPVAFACAFGLARAGVTWVPANPRNSENDNHYLFDFLDCRVLLFQSAFAESLDRLRAELPGVREWVCLDQDLPWAPSLESWLGDVEADPVEVVSDPEAVALILPTGGTTGRPKGVQMTHRVLNNFVATYMLSFHYDAAERPVNMAAAPLTHAAGIFAFPALSRGGKVVILPKPDIAAMLDTIEQHRVTEFFLPPTVIYRMLEHPGIEDRDYSSLRYFCYAAAPMSVEKLKRALQVFGPCMTQCYGQAEAPALIAFFSPREHMADGRIAPDRRLSGCGFPTPLVQVRIVDDDGNEVPRGERGEICARGDLVMKGYYKQPEKTAETLVDGWLHTGDIGFQDEDGWLHIVDRKKDMIISGGFNIYPQEIEQVIWGHEAVQDCAVIGVPDPEWGEAVTAVVELAPDGDVDADTLKTLCRERLSGVKTPKSVVFDTLPRSANGKVLKRELRDRYWEGHDRKV